MRLRRSAKFVIAAVTFLIILNGYAVYKAFFEEKVIKVDPSVLWQMENYDQDDGLKEEGEEEEEYYDEDVVIFDKLDPNEVTVNNDIFFFVTSGANDLIIREACPIEAAARLHRGRKIFVIFMTANITDIFLSDTLSLLISFENLHLRYINPVDVIKQNKAATAWLLESDFHKLPNGDAFLTQALTYLFLNKFGGSVLNFDTILVRPITALGQMVARCDEEDVLGHPLSLDSRHPILAEILSDVGAAFDAGDEAATGGRMLGRELKRLCGVDFLKELRFKDCGVVGVRAAEPTDFCPVEEDKHWMLIDPARTKLILKRMEEDAAYGLKLWSAHNGDFPDWGSRNRTTAVFEVASRACPLVMQAIARRGVL